MEFKRSRRPRVEKLEDRRMLAILLGPSDDIEALNDMNVPFGQDLGFDAAVTIDNFTVNADAGDPQDNFIYRAAATGRLVIGSINDSAAGITLDVQDSAANSLLGGAIGFGVDRSIPVVQGEVYSIVVTDTTMDEGGSTYGLELLNIAAPTPASVSLSPASDTGPSNSDGVTANNIPTFIIQADIASFLAPLPNGINLGTIDSNGPNGYDVRLVATNLSNGAQTVVNANRLGTSAVWTATTPMLADGEYLIAAQTVVQDNYSAGAGGSNTGFSQLSVPIFVTIDAVAEPVTGSIDLLASSDTGAFSFDNVTSTRTPAFTGSGPANGTVRVFAQETNPTTGAIVGLPLLVGTGTVGSENTFGSPTDGLGRWQLTTIPIDDGLWHFSAQFEDPAGMLSAPVAMSPSITNSTPMAFSNGAPANSVVAVNQVNLGIVGDATQTVVPVLDVNVTVNLTHPLANTVNLVLMSPDGTSIPLTTGNGGANPFGGTDITFDDSASVPIVGATAPFVGTFRPQTPLSGFNGLNALGNWTLMAVDTVNDLVAGTLNSFTLNITTALQVAIDTIAPNSPLLDLVTTSDTGRSDVDNITGDNTPTVTMTSLDSPISGANLLNTDNLQFRIFDRFGALAEFLLYDTANDAAVDAVSNALVLDGLTSLNLVTETLAAQFIAANPANAAVLAGGLLADGLHELRLEVLDRAGNISQSFNLSLAVDTTPPPVSFGLVSTTSTTDGIFNGSDTGSPNLAGTFEDRITSDTTPTLWGRAEANSVVTLYLDRNGNGTIEPNLDFFLGQTVAVPLDGNNAFAGGSWQITANTDLNSQTIIAALGLSAGSRDGFRPLLVTAQDVAGNPVPVTGTIGPGAIAGTQLDALGIFIDTQGPQITNVGVNNQASFGAGTFNLFDPKPLQNGFTPVVNSVTIDFIDLPLRVDQPGVVNDFIYPALDPVIAGNTANYSVVGDRVGQITITGATISQAIVAVGVTTTARAAGATLVTDSGLPAVVGIGDFVQFTSGANTGLLRQVLGVAGTTLTLDVALPGAQTVGDGFAVIPFASMNFAAVPIAGPLGSGTVVTAGNTTTFTSTPAGGVQPAPGNYLRFNSGPAAGQIRRITNYNVVTGTFTVAGGFSAAPVAGNGFTVIASTGLTTANLATARVNLTFAQPLPDDRFTLTVSDNLIDPVGNKLDGETNSSQPIPFFGTTGDGIPGGSFNSRFTIDSRPELGTVIPTTISIDINGNFAWDPNNSALGGDATNVDLTFAMDLANDAPGGFQSHDLVFAGKFAANGAVNPTNIFDQLAVYGFSYETGTRRWLVDFNSDGVVDPSVGEIFTVQPNIAGFNVAGAVPIAGNFDGILANGDEIGLYNAGNWGFDFNRNFVIDPGEVVLGTGLLGMPIVGDFDGNGFDDVAVYRNDTFTFAFSFGAFGAFGPARPVLNWGFPGVLDRPVAADMNADGIDDIGLWVPRNSTQDPQIRAEWFFLVSDPGAPNVGAGPLSQFLEAFSQPPFPNGNDIHAFFGDELALPIVGNFDPPTLQSETTVDVPVVDPTTALPLAGDYDGNGYVDAGDYQTWRSQFGQVGSALSGDGNGDGRVDAADYTVWRDNLGAGETPLALLVTQQGDYDQSGEVDANDYTIWRQQFGSSGYGLAADGNGDGRVDAADYSVWRDNLGQSSAMASAMASATSVNSPASLLSSEPSESGSDSSSTSSTRSTIGPMLIENASTASSNRGTVTQATGAVDAALTQNQQSLLLLDAALALETESSSPDDAFDLFDLVAAGEDTETDWWLPEL